MGERPQCWNPKVEWIWHFAFGLVPVNQDPDVLGLSFDEDAITFVVSVKHINEKGKDDERDRTSQRCRRSGERAERRVRSCSSHRLRSPIPCQSHSGCGRRMGQRNEHLPSCATALSQVVLGDGVSTFEPGLVSQSLVDALGRVAPPLRNVESVLEHPDSDSSVRTNLGSSGGLRLW